MRKRLIGLLAVVALLVSACAPAASREVKPTLGGDKKFPLTVTSGGLCICHAPLYVGIKKGIFAKHGLDVTFKQVKSGFEALGALHTGDAHVADAVVAVAAQAAQQGVQVQAVLMANGDPTGRIDTSKYFAIIAHPESGAKANNLASIKGKKIGVPTGTIAHQYLFYTLQKAGIDATKDITVQQVAPPDLPSALQSKSVDAIVAWEPIPLNALNLVKGSIVVQRGGAAIDYLFQRWMSPKFVKENPKETEAFVTAFIEAMHYTRSNKDEAAEIVAEAMKPLDIKIIKEALGYLNFDPRVSKNTMTAAEQGIAFTRNVGLLKGDFNLDTHINGTVVNQVERQYPHLFEDLPPIPAAQR